MAQSVQVRKQLCLTPTELDFLCRVKSAYWDRLFVPDVFYRRSEKNAVQTWMVCARDHRYGWRCVGRKIDESELCCRWEETRTAESTRTARHRRVEWHGNLLTHLPLFSITMPLNPHAPPDTGESNDTVTSSLILHCSALLCHWIHTHRPTQESRMTW